MMTRRMKMRDSDDIYARAAHAVHEGGWSSLYDLISSLPEDFFEEHFYWLFEEDEENN